jgi:hypothetical protein
MLDKAKKGQAGLDSKNNKMMKLNLKNLGFKK